MIRNKQNYKELKGLSIEELANQLDVDYSRISRIEPVVVNPTNFL